MLSLVSPAHRGLNAEALHTAHWTRVPDANGCSHPSAQGRVQKCCPRHSIQDGGSRPCAEMLHLVLRSGVWAAAAVPAQPGPPHPAPYSSPTHGPPRRACTLEQAPTCAFFHQRINLSFASELNLVLVLVYWLQRHQAGGPFAGAQLKRVGMNIQFP